MASRSAVRRPTWAAAVFLLGTAAAGPSTQPTTFPTTAPTVAAMPDYSATPAVARVPFSNRVDFAKLGGMDVRVSINGGPPMSLQVDTGSVGVIVGAVDVPGFDPKGPPGSIVYVSSGNELDGVYNTVELRFLDARGPDGKPVTAHLPVLAATGYKFHPGAVNGGTAKAKPKTTGPAKPAKPTRAFMMGVGVGRGADSHPERNAFLNLDAMTAGTMRRGYAITHDGYTLGLSPDSVGSGYLFEKLRPRQVSAECAAVRPGLRDWFDPRGTVTVGDAAPIPVGILMDTGLTNFMIEQPSVTANADVPPGTPVTVSMLDGRAHYTFTAGDKADPSAPRRVSYAHREHDDLLNTGLKALAGYDYLYDADGGYFALRPTRGQK